MSVTGAGNDGPIKRKFVPPPGGGGGKPKGGKGRSSGGSSRRPAAPKKPATVHAAHVTTREATATGGTGADPYRQAGAVSGALALLDLGGLDGLAGVLLDLAGEGRITLASALAAARREQDRVSNRAWRRPGGLQRMGGL